MSRCLVTSGLLVLLITACAEATIYEHNPAYPDIMITLTISGFTCVEEEFLDSLGTEGWWSDPGATQPSTPGAAPGSGPAPDGLHGRLPGGAADRRTFVLDGQSGVHGAPGALDSWFTISFMGNSGGGSCVFYPNPLSFPLAEGVGATLLPPLLTSFDQATVLFHFNISYFLAEVGNVTLTVYDMERRTVKTLVAHPEIGGWNHLTWDGTDSVGRKVGGGVYVCHLQSE